MARFDSNRSVHKYPNDELIVINRGKIIEAYSPDEINPLFVEDRKNKKSRLKLMDYPTSNVFSYGLYNSCF